MTSKASHYDEQLSSALVAGQWLAQTPAKTPVGAPLSWSELLRKFGKHCVGREEARECVAQVYALAVVLAATSLNEDEDYWVDRPFSLGLGDECVLPVERVDEALLGYQVLQGLKDVDHALAYYAYAVGRPEACLTHLEPQTLVFAPQKWALTETFRSLCLRAMSIEKLYPDDPPRALDAYRSAIPLFKALAASPEHAALLKPPPKLPGPGAPAKLDFGTFVRFREMWRWVERIVWRGVCLSARVEDVFGLEADGTPVEEGGAGSGHDNDLWLWLKKYTVVSASWPPNFRSEHRATVLCVYLRALVIRHAPRSLPAPPQDCGISSGAEASASAANAIATTANASAEPRAPSGLWLHTAHMVVRELKTILGVSTHFPKAGERNAKVEEFVDCCVGVWEAGLRCGGEGVGGVGLGLGTSRGPGSATGVREDWIAEILWWATKYTFNSARVLRSMVKVFYCVGASDHPRDALRASTTSTPQSPQPAANGGLSADSGTPAGRTGGTRYGDAEMARRALRLYVGVVGKAWAAWKQGVGEAVDAKAGAGTEGASGSGSASTSGENEHGDGYFEDTDTDENWFRTLVYGARMLCREAVRRDAGGAAAAWTASAPVPTPNFNSAFGSSLGVGAVGSGYEELPRRRRERGPSAVEDVREAVGLVGKAKERMRDVGSLGGEEEERWRRLNAEVELAQGICEGLLGVLGEDPSMRPALLRSAHAHLEKSVEVCPTVQGWFHLAVSYMRGGVALDVAVNENEEERVKDKGKGKERERGGTGEQPTQAYSHGRDLEKALECAAKAVEGDAGDVRCWHLLGLVLSALEKWEEAREVLERGEEVGVGGGGINGIVGGADGDGEGESRRGGERSVVPYHAKVVPPFAGVFAAEHGAGQICLNVKEREEGGLSVWRVLEGVYNPLTRSHNDGTAGEGALGASRLFFPGAPPSREEAFEEGLGVRMTKVKVVEVREGGEGAERAWVDVFGWVAEWRGLGEAAGGGAGADGAELGNVTSANTAVNGEALGLALGRAGVEDRAERRTSLGESLRSQMGVMGVVNMSQVSVSALNAVTVRQGGAEATLGIVGEMASVGSVSVDVMESSVSRADTVEEGSVNGAGYGGVVGTGLEVPTRIGITISPASPEEGEVDGGGLGFGDGDVREKERKEKGSLGGFGTRKRRSSSIERSESAGGWDTSKSKKMQQKLKSQVHKGQARISAVSKKVVGGAGGLGANLGAGLGAIGGAGKIRRSSSAPDFHKVLQQAGGIVYQASSIHSRRRVVAPSQCEGVTGGTGAVTPMEDPGTPTLRLSTSPFPGPPSSVGGGSVYADGGADVEGERRERENRLLSDLWLMSAATFRRLGKIEQAKGAIQEAEVKDENNTGVWVQLALYYVALGHHQHAISALQKALFIDPDDVPAIVHLARLYLSPPPTPRSPYHRKAHSAKESDASSPAPTANGTIPQSEKSEQNGVGEGNGVDALPPSTDVDLACGLLTQSSKGRGWDVPEVWYFLAKTYGYQRRKEKEREALRRALELSEGRGVREIADAIGLCI